MAWRSNANPSIPFQRRLRFKAQPGVLPELNGKVASDRSGGREAGSPRGDRSRAALFLNLQSRIWCPCYFGRLALRRRRSDRQRSWWNAATANLHFGSFQRAICRPADDSGGLAPRRHLTHLRANYRTRPALGACSRGIQVERTGRTLQRSKRSFLRSSIAALIPSNSNSAL
jgi:hypothetical protein